MDLKLQFLESFKVVGTDRQEHKVCAYDRMARNQALPGGEHWESTGVVEYRLEDGRLVEALADGSLRIHGSNVELRHASNQTA
ncbi:hypothetical protein EZ313_03245 [Ramlibacter henchirensis]|uniref:Uncharacterized protein n=1 Tax=Ramlibacter henchirensis TaxID=204072 RepID=A0A4Z0C3A4_9BURK|nr:hypothetical protein [Ramlibacter henchirensis]TFZ05691.1 hypothetical protein EZ313_03245 [Ramlibacter henchirensis]